VPKASEIPATVPTCFTTVRRERSSNVKQSNHYSDLNSSCYRGADKSLAQPTSRCILSDGENISFDASLYIYSTNIPPIMIINRIYETQNLLSLMALK